MVLENATLINTALKKVQNVNFWLFKTHNFLHKSQRTQLKIRNKLEINQKKNILVVLIISPIEANFKLFILIYFIIEICLICL